MKRFLIFIILFLLFMLNISPLTAKEGEVITDRNRISKETERCIGCHESSTPGIVKDWLNSRHSKISPDEALNPNNAVAIYYDFEKGSTCCVSKNSFGIKIFQYSSTKTALRTLPVKLFHCLTTISTALSGLKKEKLTRRILAESVDKGLSENVVGCYECHGLNTDRHEDRFKHFLIRYASAMAGAPDYATFKNGWWEMSRNLKIMEFMLNSLKKIE